MWKCPLLELECRSLSFPKETTPDGVPSHGGRAAGCSGRCAGPFGLSLGTSLRPICTVLLGGSFLVSASSSMHWGNWEDVRCRWNISVFYSMLIHCLEILSYSAKEISSVGSFCLSAGWENDHTGQLKWLDRVRAVFYWQWELLTIRKGSEPWGEFGSHWSELPGWWVWGMLSKGTWWMYPSFAASCNCPVCLLTSSAGPQVWACTLRVTIPRGILKSNCRGDIWSLWLAP